MPSSNGEITDTDRHDARAFIWTTQSGENIALGDMTDTHIANLEKWLKRRIAEGQAEHEARMTMICDTKNGTSFSGMEELIEDWDEALEHVLIERETRRKDAEQEL